MKLLTLDLSEIRPIQACVREETIERYIQQIKSQGYFPVPAIQNSQGYMIGDGHHTCSGLFLLNESVDVRVLELDREVEECNNGTFFRYKTIRESEEDFERFLEDLKEMDILGIGDILVLRRNLEIERLKNLQEKGVESLVA